MIDNLIPFLTFFTALGSGLVAGVFFAFSAFVMKALAQLPSEQGMRAMQSINVVVLNRLFLTVFIGTALACMVFFVLSILNWRDPKSMYLLIGCLFYLLGSFLVTSVYNVPLNDALASLDAKDTKNVSFWKEYVSKWTAWNHVRTFASIAALASFLFALL